MKNISEEDILEFGDNYKQPYRTIFFLLYLSGARASEIIRLKRKNIKITNDVLILTLDGSKTNRCKWYQMVIPRSNLTNDVIRFIDSGNNEFVFPSLAMKPHARNDVWKQFKLQDEYMQRMQPRWLRAHRVQHLEDKFGENNTFLKFFLRIRQDVDNPKEILHHMVGRK